MDKLNQAEKEQEYYLNDFILLEDDEEAEITDFDTIQN